MKDNDVRSSIKNAFDYVMKVYKETSFFLQDLEKELASYNISCLNPKKTGANLSGSLESTNLWLTSYISRFFITKEQPERWRGRKTLYLSGSVIFAIDGQGREPLFTYGVFQSMDADAAIYYYDWPIKVLQNEGGYFSYNRDGKEMMLDEIPSDRKPTIFKCRLSDESHAWPKQGNFVVFPLTDIRGSKDISLLAKEMGELWQERNTILQLLY